MKNSQAFTLAPPVVLCLAAGLEQFLNFSRGCASWPFAVSLFIVGLPHGALDLQLLRQLIPRHRRSASIAYMCRYLFMMFAMAATLFYRPVFMICLFGLMSSWHFGTADWSYRVSGQHRTKKHFWIISRGLFVISLPLWWHPQPSAAVIERLAEILGRQQSFNPDLVASISATALAACVVCYGVAVRRERDTRVLLQDLSESAAIFASAALLDPMFFVGLYFLVWHSWKHMGQLDKFGSWVSRTWAGRVYELHVASLPLLFPSLVLIFALAGRQTGGLTSMNLALSGILFFIIVTLPHHLLVDCMLAEMSKAGRSRLGAEDV